MNNVGWYNNLLKGVVNNNEYVGIGFEVGARDMKVHNNTVMSQWPTAGYAFADTVGGSMVDIAGSYVGPYQ
jgi:hypothetical protein